MSEDQQTPRRADELDSVERIYQREYDAMVRLAFLLTGSEELAPEFVHDAFVGVLRRAEKIPVTGGYVRTAVVNRCRDHHRRAAVFRRRAPQLVASRLEDSGTAGPEASEHPDVVEALQHLSAPQREAIALRYYLDLTVREVAQALDVPLSTAKSHLRRGLEAMKLQLEGTIS